MNRFTATARSNAGVPYSQGTGQPFHKPRTSLGAAGHWVHLAATMAPLAISEMVEDAAKRRKAIALVSVGSALAYQTLWTLREQDRRAGGEKHQSSPAR